MSQGLLLLLVLVILVAILAPDFLYIVGLVLGVFLLIWVIGLLFGGGRIR